MDKSDQQPTESLAERVKSFAEQHRDKLQEIQSGYLSMASVATYRAGDIVAVACTPDEPKTEPAIVLASFVVEGIPWCVVQTMDASKKERGEIFLMEEIRVIVPILLVAREGRNG